MTIYENGKIHTMDDSLAVVDSIAVQGGKIVARGAETQLLEGDRVDLGGKTVIPGLIDTHLHLFTSAESEADGELVIPTSISELLTHLAEQVKTLPKGEWVVYKNTYPLRIDELRYPTLAELDAVAPDHPVAVDGYYSQQLNSCALGKIDLDHLPMGGKVVRDEAGNLTGVLCNCNSVFAPLAAKREHCSLEDAIAGLMQEYNRVGITAAIEGIGNFGEIEAVQSLCDANRQTVRMRYTLIPPLTDREAFLEKIKALRLDPEFGAVRFLKNVVDGGILTGTSLMQAPFCNKEEIFGLHGMGDAWCGNHVTKHDLLVDTIKLAQSAGLQHAAHCVGDGAVDALLKAYEEVGDTEGRRHAVLHGDFLDDALIRRAKAVDAQILFQPAWHYMDAPNVGKILPETEAEKLQPYRKMLDSGVKVAAGSDHMVKWDERSSCNPYDPFLGLYNMVTCRARDGKAYRPEQAVTREEALLCYTRYAARASFDENLYGSLEVGKQADFVVLDCDYFTCEDERIAEIRPTMTVVGGKVVYRA
ncbi:MAG: amidohydrolase [Oscillospiraceae bacterium]|nr:amidohydrolase [Oscillospiraceae bacterium]